MKKHLHQWKIAAVISLFAVSRYALAAGGADGQNGSTVLKNPLKSTSVMDLIEKIIDVILVFATPIIVLMIMYAGFLFVTARGNEGQIEKAKHALLWSVVGGVIVLGAKIIAEVIKGTVTSF